MLDYTTKKSKKDNSKKTTQVKGKRAALCNIDPNAAAQTTSSFQRTASCTSISSLGSVSSTDSSSSTFYSPAKKQKRHSNARPNITSPKNINSLSTTIPSPLSLPPTSFVAVANAGLARHAGVLTNEGSGGVYIIRSSSGRTLAVYKPSEEEPYAPRNPRGRVGRLGANSPLRPGFRVGKGFTRERAVFLMDSNSLIPAGVPQTVTVTSTNTNTNTNINTNTNTNTNTSNAVTKHASSTGPSSFLSPSFSRVSSQTTTTSSNLQLTAVTNPGYLPSNQLLNGDFGSLQQFCPSVGTMDDYGTNGLDVLNTQLIACLDIRTMNQDRHGANLLVTATRQLVPIDHGFALPSAYNLDRTTFYWSTFPQICNQPPTKAVIELVKSLDTVKDAKLLKDCGIDAPSILSMRIGTKLLQTGILQLGKTIGEIADLMLRNNPNIVSAVETSIATAMCKCSNANKYNGECTFGVGQINEKCQCQHCEVFDNIDFEELLK